MYVQSAVVAHARHTPKYKLFTAATLNAVSQHTQTYNFKDLMLLMEITRPHLRMYTDKKQKHCHKNGHAGHDQHPLPLTSAESDRATQSQTLVFLCDFNKSPKQNDILPAEYKYWQVSV